MNNEVKTKWLEALRSGRYHQDKGYLRNPEGFCCLGVLCDLYIKEHGLSWSYQDRHEPRYSFDTAERMLPHSVMSWAGLNMRDPVVMVQADGWDITLATMNDRGASFDEIADMIEERL